MVKFVQLSTGGLHPSANNAQGYVVFPGAVTFPAELREDQIKLHVNGSIMSLVTVGRENNPLVVVLDWQRGEESMVSTLLFSLSQIILNA